jgi:glycosyltransferase involved in cell wall biosynthesis
MTNYSIVIPHYNLPALLRRCLGSIPQRDDIQVIVVDDGSSEESKSALKEIGNDFPNVQIVYQENLGGGAARNKGLAEAKGKFVMFADADDYFCEKFIELVDRYATQDNDIVYFNANFVDADTGKPAKQKNHVDEIIKLYKKNPAKGETPLRYYFGEPWCKMVRRSIIEDNGIRFEQTKIHNDTRFSYLVGYFAKNMAVCEEPIYNYIVRQGSVSKIISDDRLIARVSVFGQKNRFLQEHGIDFFDKLMVWPFKYCKEHGKGDIYMRCLEEAAKYGYDEKFIRKLLRQNKIETFLPRVKKKICKMMGIKK